MWGQGRVRGQGRSSIFGRCLLPSRVIYTQSTSIAGGFQGRGGGQTEVSYLSGWVKGPHCFGGAIKVFELECFF